MDKASWKQKLSYRFDGYIARGAGALIGGLGILSLILIVVAGAVVALTGVAPEGEGAMSFAEGAWESMMRTLDAGTMGGDTGWGFRLVMFLVTVGGVFIISTLIGVLTSGLEGKLEELKKGKSRVIESGHTVILNWSSQIHTVISEVCEANANRKSACIVILGDRDKVEMEEEVRARIPDTKRTRVVCRSGSPSDLADLTIASIDAARAVIVLSPEGDNPDAEVIKSILAITNNPGRRAEPYHIVAEIRDPRNMEVARMVGRDEVELVLVGDLVSRIVAQTCRQSGLSVVYTELLNFGGDEIYFKEEPGLVGRTYGEALLAYEDSTPIGIWSAAEGKSTVNPPMDRRIGRGDQVIAISQDDDTIRLSGKAAPAIREADLRDGRRETAAAEKTILFGWNWRAPLILNELDAYVAKGSAALVVADREDGEAEIGRLCSGIRNMKVSYRNGDTTDRRLLDGLGVGTYDHIIILCSDGLGQQEADARTLITLLHLRDMAEKARRDFSIVSEMMDLRNRELAKVTKADDFIVSDTLISLILAQVSENKRLNAVLTDIFDPEGSEIYIRPAGDYVASGVELDFYAVTEAARRRGHTAIGYKIQAKARDEAAAYGVVINPDKSARITFAPGDRIIVIAED